MCVVSHGDLCIVSNPTHTDAMLGHRARCVIASIYSEFDRPTFRVSFLFAFVSGFGFAGLVI